ncbi:MAG TPA: TspO/MBR family protein [Candidatus Paceibacterota bacterium]
MKINNILKLVISIGVSLGAGAIGSFFTAPAVQSNWYLELIKPAFNPPSWVFGPVWTTLYILMGISLFLIWKINPSEARPGERRRAVILFFIQLVLNVFWSIIFFGLHSLGGAFIEIVFLWLAILATIIAFAKISKSAAWLLAPYILWVSFAVYLNFAIWLLN